MQLASPLGRPVGPVQTNFNFASYNIKTLYAVNIVKKAYSTDQKYIYVLKMTNLETDMEVY